MQLARPTPDSLDRLRSAAPHAGVFLDFDGTLAPIVDDPLRVTAVAGAGEVLGALATRYAVVAVVSGRPVTTLMQHLPGAAGVRLCGLYGLEIHDAEGLRTDEAATGAREAVARAADALDRDLDDVWVERKGLSVAVHFRRSADPLSARATAEAAVADAAAREGLTVRAGRQVLELFPPIAVDKGSTVRAMVSAAGLTAGFVAGDDLGDVPAFLAIGALDPSIRMIVRSPESPAELVDAADSAVDTPEEALDVLRTLV